MCNAITRAGWVSCRNGKPLVDRWYWVLCENDSVVTYHHLQAGEGWLVPDRLALYWCPIRDSPPNVPCPRCGGTGALRVGAQP